MSAPAFSVVIPAFNAGAYLREALDSIFDQVTGLAFEVILVDDGSTDDTAGIAAAFPGLRYIPINNGGAGRARNIGIEAARSDIVLLLDADDRALPGRLDLQARFMLANPQQVLTFGNWLVQNEPENYLARFGIAGSAELFQEFDRPLQRLLVDGCFVPTSTVGLRKTAFVAAGGFAADRHYAEDYALWLRMAADGSFAFIDRPLSWYRTAAPGRLTFTSATYLGIVLTVREGLLHYEHLLEPQDRRRAMQRYAASVDALLRYEWASFGRDAVMARMTALEPLLPAHLRWRYEALTLLPASLPRLARRGLRRMRKILPRLAGVTPNTEARQ